MPEEDIEEYTERIGFLNWWIQEIDILHTRYIPKWYAQRECFRGIDGVVYVIDCDIRINTPELKAGGTRTLTTEVEIIK